jgi:ABC-type uncharacterized transport system substrate-binding protein
MRRREFITLLGGAVATWPLKARAEQPAMQVIGLLHSGSAGAFTRLLIAFHEGLKENGYVEGQNIAIEQRWAEGQYDRLPALATDLVRRDVAVIATMGGEGSALAAKAASSSIPVTFVLGSDPVKLGLVKSLNRPGGNVTGIVQFTTALESKRLGLLLEMVPKANVIGVLINPSRQITEAQLAEIQHAATRANARIVILNAKTESEFAPSFAAMAKQQVGALLVAADPFFFSHRLALVAMAARHKVPAMYEWRDFPDAGGLMSYGTDLAYSYRQSGVYIGRILKGEKPADLPVQQATKFEFVINLKTAKELGLDVPAGLSARADEVIE